MNVTSTWQLWAVLSAVFAALTAIFAKVGIENVNADFATFIRTIVILVTLAFILLATANFRHPTQSLPAVICFSCCQDWQPARPGSVISAR